MATIDYGQLCKILQCFTSHENNLRQEAEDAFNSYKETHFEELLLVLIRVMKENPDATLRTHAVTSIRSMFRPYLVGKNEALWTNLNPQTKSFLRSQLFEVLEKDKNSTVQHSACVTISVLGGRLVASGEWAELSPKLVSMIETGDAGSQERALKILAELVPYISSIIHKNLGGLHRIISVCSKSPVYAIRYQVLCFISSLVINEPRSVWKTFQDTLPDLLDGLSLISDNLSEYPDDYLSALVVIADVDAGFFKTHLLLVFEKLSFYASEHHDEAGQMAVEVLLSIAENKPSMCLKVPNFVMKMVHILLELMLTVKNDGSWIDNDDNESSIEETRNYDVGESGLDRLALALGGEHVMNVIFHYVSEYLRKEEWQYKLVAIMAISQTAEYLPEEDLDNHLEEITRMLIAQLKHSHHYVRFAACQAIGQIATDHHPYFQNTYSHEVFPAVIATIDDVSPKVQSHAISALINFTEEANKADFIPYADTLMQKLFTRISPDKPIKLREQSLTCIAVVAGVLEKNFLKYYNIVMPATKEIFRTATSRELCALRGRAVECASIIGISVGKEVFEADAHDVMRTLLEIDAQGVEADDTVSDYMNDAFRRMCRIMKEAFYPYVQHLMPKLLKSLSLPENAVDNTSEDGTDMTIATLAKGDCSGLKTSAVQDMIHSLELLSTIVEIIGLQFKDFVIPTAQTLLPLLKIRLNETVKRSLLDTLAELIRVSKELGMDPTALSTWVTEVLEQSFQNLTIEDESQGEEPNLDLLVVEASGLAKCIRNAGPNVLTNAQIAYVCNQTFMFMKDSNQRRAHLSIQKQDPEYDEEDLTRLEEDECSEQTFRSTLLEIIAALMKNHPQPFLQYGASLCQDFITAFIHPNCNNDDRALALYVCDDILEHLGDHGAPLWPVFAEQLVNLVLDNEPGVRQAAAYGLIQAAHCSQFPVELIQRGASNLVMVLNEPTSKGNAHSSSRDNVIAALGALVLHRGLQLGSKFEEYLQYWIDNLPLKVDDEEGRRTHKDVVDLMLKGNPQVLGQNNSNIPKLMAFCAAIYKTEFSTSEIDEGIRKFIENIGFDVVREIGLKLTKKHQQGLDRILKDIILDKSSTT